MNSQILSSSEVSVLTTHQKICGVIASGAFLASWLSVTPVLVGVFVVGLATVLGSVRLRGDWLSDLFVRGWRFSFRSRFRVVSTASGRQQLPLQSPSQWTPNHRGRLDLRDEEIVTWQRVIDKIENSVRSGDTEKLSITLKGNELRITSLGMELPAPWVQTETGDTLDIPQWIYESWTHVQSPLGFHRTYEVRDFRQCRKSIYDVFADNSARWSLHVFIETQSRKSSLNRTRRERHATDVAVSWRKSSGVTPSASLTSLRAIRRYHEERVALGAALVQIQLRTVVTAPSRAALTEACEALVARAEQHNVTLHFPRGCQGESMMSTLVAS